jgi:glycosyltransferase involved in cell wall biosynthesis
MSRPRVVLLRGHDANPWDLRPWELLADRYDVRVLVTGSNRFELGSLALPVSRVAALRDRLPRGRVGDLAALAAGDRYLGLEEALAEADLVHAAELGVPYSHGPALLKERLGFRFVLTVWETIPFGDAYRRFRGRRQRRETIPHVDLFLAATERAGRGLVLEGAPAERIVVSPPGIDTGRFAATAPPTSHLVLSVGRLVWAKGHQDLLRALAWLRRDGLDARAEIVGAGPEEQKLQAHARDLGVESSVVWRRSVAYDEMPEVFARASCFVLASLPMPMWEEQFGMVLAEAAAAGLPIVAADSGAIPEVVQGEATLYPAGDWRLLADALRPILEQPPERRRPEALVAEYSTEAAAQRIAGAYERVLSSV